MVLGNNWLVGLRYRIDKRDARYWENSEEKRLYYVRNDINILSPSLYTFYELLFPNFTAINSDGEVIITKFFKHKSECSSSETESESESFSSESEDEVTYVNDVPPMIMDTADTPNDFITTFSD
ncbi:hypothetical protein RhiirA5_478029 [Rhizophagus irregularis]|uniref:Uncharacterized protein n=1 Tax=Rhizophagus irregularis TaxID=588596 RepID=A0A2N0PMN3_9GLOM|nr:hypothetical protein RhiirA5_478029 [Rhizophagus irregularis]